MGCVYEPLCASYEGLYGGVCCENPTLCDLCPGGSLKAEFPKPEGECRDEIEDEIE